LAVKINREDTPINNDYNIIGSASEDNNSALNGGSSTNSKQAK